MLAKHATDPALGYIQLVTYLIDASSTTRRA
jgi:hypothetical protein